MEAPPSPSAHSLHTRGPTSGGGFRSLHHPQEQHLAVAAQREQQLGGGHEQQMIHQHRPTPMERAYASHLLRTHFANPPSPPSLIEATSRTSPHSYNPHDTTKTSTSTVLHLLDTPMLLEVEDGTENGICVRGGDAVPFLTRSGVDRRVLRGAWNLVDPDGVGTLTRRCQFLLILRLVALVQSGLLRFRDVDDEDDVSLSLRSGLVDFDRVVDALAPPSFGAGTVPTGAALVRDYELERIEHWRLVMEYRAANPTVPVPPPQPHMAQNSPMFGPAQPSMPGGGIGVVDSVGIALQQQQQQQQPLGVVDDGGSSASSFGGFGGGGTGGLGPPAAAASGPISISDAFRDLVPDDLDAPLPIDEFGDFEDAPATSDSGFGDGADGGGDGDYGVVGSAKTTMSSEWSGGGPAGAMMAPATTTVDDPPREWGGAGPGPGVEKSSPDAPSAAAPLTMKATTVTTGSSSSSSVGGDADADGAKPDTGDDDGDDNVPGGDGAGGSVGRGNDRPVGGGAPADGWGVVLDLPGETLAHRGGDVGAANNGGAGREEDEDDDDGDFGDFEDATPTPTPYGDRGASSPPSADDASPDGGEICGDGAGTGGEEGDGGGGGESKDETLPIGDDDEGADDDPPSSTAEDHQQHHPMVMMNADVDRIGRLSAFDELMGGASEERELPKMMTMTPGTAGMAAGDVDDGDDGDDFGDFEDANDDDDDHDGDDRRPPPPLCHDAPAPPPPMDTSSDTFGSFADAATTTDDVAETTGAADDGVVDDSEKTQQQTMDDFDVGPSKAAAVDDDDDEVFGSFDDGGAARASAADVTAASSAYGDDDGIDDGGRGGGADRGKLGDAAAVGGTHAECRHEEEADTEVDSSHAIEGGDGGGVGTPAADGEESALAPPSSSLAPSGDDGEGTMKRRMVMRSSSSGLSNGGDYSTAAAFVDPFEDIAPPQTAPEPILTSFGFGVVDDPTPTPPAEESEAEVEAEAGGGRSEGASQQPEEAAADAAPTEWGATSDERHAEGVDFTETPAHVAPAMVADEEEDDDFGDFEDAAGAGADTFAEDAAPSLELPSQPREPSTDFSLGTTPTAAMAGNGEKHDDDVDFFGFADEKEEEHGEKAGTFQGAPYAEEAPLDAAAAPVPPGPSKLVCNGGSNDREGDDDDEDAFFSDFGGFEEAGPPQQNDRTDAARPSSSSHPPISIRGDDDDDPPAHSATEFDDFTGAEGAIISGDEIGGDGRRKEQIIANGGTGTGSSFFAAFEATKEGAEAIDAIAGCLNERSPPSFRAYNTGVSAAAATAGFGAFDGAAPIGDVVPMTSEERGTNGDESFAAFGSNGEKKAAAMADVAFASSEDAEKVDEAAEFGDFDGAYSGEDPASSGGAPTSSAELGDGDERHTPSPTTPAAAAAEEQEDDEWGGFNDAGFDDGAVPSSSPNAPAHNDGNVVDGATSVRPDGRNETPVANGVGSNAIQAESSSVAAGDHQSSMSTSVLGTNGWDRDRIMTCPASELGDALLLVELVDEAVGARKVEQIHLQIKSLSEQKAKAALEDRFEDAIKLKTRISQLEGELPNEDDVRRWRDVLCRIADGSAEGDETISSRLTLERMRAEVADLAPRLPQDLKLRSKGQHATASNGDGIYASGSLLSIFEDRVMRRGLETSSGRSLGKQGKVDPKDAWERQRSATRCLSLCRALATSHSMHGAHWRRVVVATNARLSMATALLRDMDDSLSGVERDVIRRSETIRVFLNGLRECVRVVRHIAATVADLYCFDYEMDMTEEGAYPWNGIDAIADGGRTEALWVRVIDLARELGIDASLIDLETVPEIRRRAMSLLLTTGSSKREKPEVCQLTLHPLISSSWTLSNGTKLGNADTRSKVDFEGKVFMACAANLWANMVCSNWP